ncbi:MAG: tetratricopeptide repeat protein [Woeseiaceae bacterium]|nr:tetratricopeptide repeat protein [Woeseiaceae bacterium]
MDDLLSEKEQLERMRTWWSDYGNYVIAGIVLGAAILFGINHYQTTQRDAELAASALYDRLTDEIVDGSVETAEAIAGEIDADYGDSAYATQAKLAMARLYMDQNRDEDAADALRDLLAADAPGPFTHIARIRLAKIYLYQDKAEEVVELLQGQASEAFAARYAESLGDAYVALGRFAEAREAYERALDEPPQGATVDQSFVRLKLIDLPVEVFDEDSGEESE